MSAETEKKIEPVATDTESEHISLRVVSQDGGEVLFKIKKQTPMRRLMEAYCQRMAVPVNGVRFLFDGNRVQPDNTPKSLDMADKDIIDVVLQQVGGSF
jgi:small ubiquitin-related modifier